MIIIPRAAHCTTISARGFAAARSFANFAEATDVITDIQ